MGKLIDTDKDSILNYSVNWGAWLATGETIATKTVTGSGCTVNSSSITTGSKPVAGVATPVASGAVTANVTAGTTDGTITFHIVTSTGQVDDRTIDLRITVK